MLIPNSSDRLAQIKEHLTWIKNGDCDPNDMYDDLSYLLDEVERLTTERMLLVGVWRAADEYNDCNDGLTCNCVDNLAKALDKYDEYRKALTVVNGG